MERNDLRVIRRRELEKKLGISRSGIYARISNKSPNFDPSFPRPISIGARAVGWIEAEVDEWLATRVAQSRNAA